MKNQKGILLLLLAFLNFTHILDFMIMMPLGNYLMPYFDISPREFSFLVGAYTLTGSFSGFMAGFFIDRFERKTVLILTYTGFVVGTIACGLSQSYPVLLGARVLAGFFGGLLGAQVLATVADLFPYEERGKAMGIVMSSFAVASTFGVPFSLYLARQFNWHGPFILIGILGLLLMPALFFFVPNLNTGHHEGPKKFFDSIRPFFQKPDLSLTLVFSCLLMLGHFLIIPFINPFMEFNLGYSKTQTPMIYLVGGLSSLVGGNLLGRWADKKGKPRIYLITTFSSLGLILAITHMVRIPFYIILAIFGVWFALVAGRNVSAQAMVTQKVPPEQRGSFMSFNSSLQQLGMSLASFISGFIVVKNTDGSIAHYGILGLMSVGILLITLALSRRLFLK